MIRFLLNKQIQDMKSRYDYDVQYMEDILQSNLAAFFKYWGFTSMSSHNAQVPIGPLFAARIRTLINEDCGPCIQLAINMALEAELDPALIENIIKNQQDMVPKEVALTMRFTELVLAHDPDVDELKAQIVSLWGQSGLITLSFSISTYRVFPTLKYALGYGKTCHKIEINKAVYKPS